MAAHIDQTARSKARQHIGALAHRARLRMPGGDRDAPTTPLDQLGARWYRIDDIRWPGQSFADVDHVMVGPAGMFVVDNRKWWRTLDQDVRGLRTSGPTSGDVFWGVSAAAHAVGSLLGMAEHRPTPIICVFGGPEVNTMAGHLLVCSASTLVPRLNGMPEVYDDEEIVLLAERVRTNLAPATGGLTTVPDQRRP